VVADRDSEEPAIEPELEMSSTSPNSFFLLGFEGIFSSNLSYDDSTSPVKGAELGHL
jgi:hypothetical protein